MKAYYTEDEKSDIKETIRDILMETFFEEWNQASEIRVNEVTDGIMAHVIKPLVEL